MLAMPTRPGTPPARRVVLVPAAASSSRGDELVRRYRLARLRLTGREGAAEPPARIGSGERRL
jgi:hypothetical protein